MNSDPDHADAFLQALRQDLPPKDADDGMRTRLRAAGMVLAPTSAKATALAAVTKAGAGAQVGGGIQSTGAASMSASSASAAGAASGAGAASTVGAATGAGAMSSSATLVWATLSSGGAAKLVGMAGVLAVAGAVTWQDVGNGSSNEEPASGTLSAPVSLTAPVIPVAPDRRPEARALADLPGRELIPKEERMPVVSNETVKGNNIAPSGLQEQRARSIHQESHRPTRTSGRSQQGDAARQGLVEEDRAEQDSAVLGAEANIMHRALSALQRGDLKQAARHLDSHERTFPRGALVKERERTRVKLSRALEEAQ